MFVLGETRTKFQLHLIDKRQTFNNWHQSFNVVVVDRSRGIKCASRVYTHHLVCKRVGGLQTIWVELPAVLAHLVTGRCTDFTCRKLHHRALEVKLDNILQVLRAGLQVGTDGVETILGKRHITLEQGVQVKSPTPKVGRVAITVLPSAPM